MNLSTVVFHGFTLGQIIGALAGIAVFFVLAGFLKKLFAKKEESAHLQAVKCSCGWQGRISSLAGRCPKCNQPLGARKAR